MQKKAGGGSRTLKSLFRTTKRLLEQAGQPSDPTSVGRFLNRHGRLFNTSSPFYVDTSRDIVQSGVHRRNPLHLTQGGLWRTGGGPAVGAKPRDMRAARGKFSIDPVAVQMPVGHRGNAMLFNGTVPPKVFKYRKATANPTLPRKYRNYHDYRSMPREFSPRDALTSARWRGGVGLNDFSITNRLYAHLEEAFAAHGIKQETKKRMLQQLERDVGPRF